MELDQIFAELRAMRADIDHRLTTLEARFDALGLANLDEQYVRRSEFSPVQKVVYGLVGMVLVAVVTALVATVVNTNGG